MEGERSRGRGRGAKRRRRRAGAGGVLALAGIFAMLAGTLAVLAMTGGGKERLAVPGESGTGGQTAASAGPSQEITIRSESRENGEVQEPAASQQEEPVPGPSEESVRLLFGGDVLLSSHVLTAYDQGGGIGGVLDEGFREEIELADIFMVNQEFPFSLRGEPAEDKQYTFRLPPEKVSIFQEMGIDIVTLANNHALDFGVDALLDSCATLDGAGILHVGAGEDLEEAAAWETVERKGKKIGFLGATRVIPVSSWAANQYNPGMLSTYDPTRVLEQIKAAKDVCDFVVVYVHWGIERAEHPEEYQKTMGRQYIDAGADLVIGSHPHVLQGIEYYKGKPIVYSLGNFVFGSSIPRTLLLRAEWDGEQVRLKVIPGTSGAGYTRTLTDPAKRQEFFQYLESISFGITVGEDGTITPV